MLQEDGKINIRGNTVPTTQTTVSTIIFLILLALGGIAFARLGQQQAYEAPIMPSVTSSPHVEAAVDAHPETETVLPIESVTDPCSSTVTEHSSESGTNSVNESNTVVHCASDSHQGTKVDIRSDVNQSATTGDSDGQSGTTSNSNTSHIDVDIN